MTHSIRPDDRLLDRYLADEATPTERRDVDAWLSQVPMRREALAALADPGETPTFAVAAVHARIEAYVDAHADTGSSTRASAPTPQSHKLSRTGGWTSSKFRPWLMTGLALASLTFAAIITRREFTAPAAEQFRQYVTTTGQQTTITLPDGSRVRLAPQSRAGISKTWTERRVVTLVGEAYFEVTSAAAKPFVVQTGTVSTRVLGTAFDVRHYPTDTAVRVAVVTGKVLTAGRGSAVTLSAGTVAHVTDSSATTASTQDLSAFTSWTDGTLVFNRASVATVLATMGRWYGYDFRIADSVLAAQHITATFKTSDPAETLAELKRLLHVSMTFDGTIVTLRRSPTSDTRRPSPKRRHDDRFSTQTEVGR